MTSITKLNDKRFYFSESVIFLAVGYPSLDKLGGCKKVFKKIEELIKEYKFDMLRLENDALFSSERLRILKVILLQPKHICKIESGK